jgi:pyridoxamine 5'-phosphate oxidase
LNVQSLPSLLPENPLELFGEWFRMAVADQSMTNPDAMTLATITATNRVSARMVLCKEIVSDPGYLVFYTNYASSKGQQISGNSHVAAVFYWDALGCQVRIEGVAIKSPPEESDLYFASRDRDSRIGAWTSDQSMPIATHEELLNKHLEMHERFADDEVPRPSHWGGYRLGIESIELWHKGAARLHDRARWERTLDTEANTPAGFRSGPWQSARLQP